MADEEFMFGDLFATVRVQDLPASREVVAVERQENGTWRVCGSAIANADGIAELGIEGSKTSRVYAFAIDHWGEPFTPNRTVAYGDIIRPSVFLGWLYRVTAPGVLPGEEPVWWNSTPGMPRPVGSAMAQAEMYFQPIAHGPVDIEWEEKGAGDPHWDNVVSLLHFDGNLVDETGLNIWSGDRFNYSSGIFGQSIQISKGAGITTPEKQEFIFDGEFTIEAFIDGSPTWSHKVILSSNANNWINGAAYLLLIHPSRKLEMGTYAQGHLIKGNFIFPEQVFFFTLSATMENYYIFCDGILVDTIPRNGVSVDFSRYGTRLGANWDGLHFTKTIDELRITKGVARYTENFTPPTEPFPNFK